MVSILLWEVGDEVRVCPVGFVQESSFGKILLLLCESSRTQRHLWESNGTTTTGSSRDSSLERMQHVLATMQHTKLQDRVCISKSVCQAPQNPALCSSLREHLQLWPAYSRLTPVSTSDWHLPV